MSHVLDELRRIVEPGPELRLTFDAYGDARIMRRDATQVVRSVADLPQATMDDDGTLCHVLDPGVWEFNGFTTTPAGLRWGASTVVLGLHAMRDGMIYTGTGAALRATDVGFSMSRMSVIAPAGDAFDLSGRITDELDVDLCNIYGCDGLGQIDGFRVPFLLKTNLEGFNTGLTFGGTSEKILVDSSPFRNAAAAARGLTFGPTLNTKIVDVTGCYFKDFGAGGVGISLDAAAQVTEYGLVRGVAFSGMATPTEGFDSATVGWDFAGNAGVRNSRVLGSLSMTGNAVATVLAQNVWTKIAGVTAQSFDERVSMPQNNRLTYIGRREVDVILQAALSITGTVNGQMVDFAFYKNGAALPGAAVQSTALVGSASARGDQVAVMAPATMAEDDYIELWMRCTSGASDATADSLQIVMSD